MSTTSTTYTLEDDTTPVSITATVVEGALVLTLMSYGGSPQLNDDDIVEVPTTFSPPAVIRVKITNDTGGELYGRSTLGREHTNFTDEGDGIYCDHTVPVDEQTWSLRISREPIQGDDPDEISPKITIKKKGGGM